MEKDTQFTILENKTIGRNISLYRKIKGMKAMEVAEKLGLKEAAYTRYERGEAAITVNMVQQIAELMKVDPLHLLAVHPGSFIESGNNSPNAVLAMNSSNWHTINEDQMKMTLRLIESVTQLNERLVGMLEKR
jgi:transcriptional regulator with XRE-family HTH domain